MNDISKRYLFGKHILVNETGPDAHAFETVFSLANLLGIRLVSGAELAAPEMISFSQEMLGAKVPVPFYRSFPAGVRELSPDKLLFDQLVHYSVTYGFGDFSRPGHSILEGDFERIAFKENTEIRDFSVVTEAEAEELIARAAKDLCTSTRPLDPMKFELVLQYVKAHGTEGLRFASQDLPLRLLQATRDLSLAARLNLNDILKLTERIQFEEYGSDNPKKLNLKNKDRKFLTALLRDRIAACPHFRDCYEKQARWAGLLHHIHFQAETEKEILFCQAMRSGKNNSVWSQYEKALTAGETAQAVALLAGGKGAGAVIRQLNCLLSRGAGIRELTPYLASCGPVPLIQLLLQYASYRSFEKRTFTFTRFNLLRSHRETDEEQNRRRSFVSEDIRRQLMQQIRAELGRRWAGRLGTVYLGEDMKRIALPVSEAASQGGFGVLPKGSRLPLPEGKKLRAFTYWEKVNDIDLSVIGLDSEDRQVEFSWRTMADSQSDAITYSGDQTSGYNGGSEFFDIDLNAFRAKYPDIRVLIFCNNVFTAGIRFADCFCRAGYMLRDTEESGEIFEPKTVTSAYTVNCPSSFAYLFGLDLVRREFVWLNSAVNGKAQVAGETGLAHLRPLFSATDTISLYDMLQMQASSLTDDPLGADVVATDEDVPAAEGALRIHSYDLDTVLRLIG